MLVNTITSTNCTPQTIVIGRRATHDTLQIVFDLAYLIENYGDGTAVLAVKRSQDESAYPAVVTQEDNILTWTVSETDTAYVGSGECQLMWYIYGGLAKTIIYPMVVMRDILQTTEEPPDGYENWIEHLTELGAETQQNAQDAEQSASEAKASEDSAAESAQRAEDAAGMLVDVSATATTLEPGQPATAEYDEGVFKFGIPKGDKLTYADLTEADKEDLVQGPIKDAQDDAVEAVGTAKNNAVDAVNQAGTTQKNAVNQAGTTAVNAVGREGTTQVERVTTEGNTQVGRVQDKGDEVIASIPSDYSDLTAEVDDLTRQLSDTKSALKNINLMQGQLRSSNGLYYPNTSRVTTADGEYNKFDVAVKITTPLNCHFRLAYFDSNYVYQTTPGITSWYNELTIPANQIFRIECEFVDSVQTLSVAQVNYLKSSLIISDQTETIKQSINGMLTNTCAKEAINRSSESYLKTLDISRAYTIGEYVKYSNLATLSNVNYKRTDFIFVPKGMRIDYKLLGADDVAVISVYSDKCFGLTYNSVKVAGVSTEEYKTGTITINSDSYIVVCEYFNEFNDSYVKFNYLNFPYEIKKIEETFADIAYMPLVKGQSRFSNGLFYGGDIRMTTPEDMFYSFEEDVLLYTDFQKYKTEIFLFDADGTLNQSIGWNAFPVKITANTKFRVMIALIDDSGLDTYTDAQRNDILKTTILYRSNGRFASDDINLSIQSIHKVSDTLYGRDYVQAENSRVLSEINELLKLGKLITIGFNTDQHLNDTNKGATIRGLRALSMLTRRIPFNLVCLGGDVAGYYGSDLTVDGIIDDILSVNEQVYDAWCPVVSIAGNHEADQNNEAITNAEIFNLNFKRCIVNYGVVPKNEDATNGYLDDEADGIRFIFCDTRSRYTPGGEIEYNAETECRAWLTQCLSNLPTGYKAIVLSHQAVTDEYNDSNGWQGIECQDILATYSSNIICCIFGHIHKSDAEKDSNGINYIGTTSASYDEDIVRTETQANETAFDIYCIAPAEEKIYVLRWGAGGATANRIFTY